MQTEFLTRFTRRFGRPQSSGVQIGFISKLHSRMITPLQLVTILLCTVVSALVHAEGATRANRILQKLYTPDDSVLVAAHRGAWRQAPENSIAAIEKAIDLGVDIVEIDVRETQDGRFVVIHDTSLERTTNGSGNVKSHTLAELKQLRLRNHKGKLTPHKIPTLEETLKISQGRVLVYLDKTENNIVEVYEAVKRLGSQDEVLFYGHRSAEKLRQVLGDSTEKIHYLPKVGDKTDRPSEYIAAFHGHAPAFVTSFRSVDSPVVARFAKLKSAGARIWVSPLWGEICGGKTDERALSNPDENWGWHIARGATIFCTDRPGELLDYLRSRGFMSSE